MTSTIRLATPNDAEAIAELLNDPAVGERLTNLLVTAPGQRYALVLDEDDGSLAAAAVITLDAAHHGHLELLAVSPRHAEDPIERRMVGVAQALCAAFGCTAPDVLAA